MKLKGMDKFAIGFWNTVGLSEAKPETADMWRDLGITLAMSPGCGEGDRDKMLPLLDRAAELGIKVIICDARASWRESLTRRSEAEYRAGIKSLVADYGSHPATFGFFIGDEPDAPEAADAFRALRIARETAPELTAFLNLLPWFDWIGERMGAKYIAPYLDRAVDEGRSELLSYDCYSQMWDGDSGWDPYFENLRNYCEAVKRHNVPFNNIVLSCGHYRYRCPSKEDMLWQLNTSVACGASGVSWFFIQLPGMWDNYRNAPINQLGERTERFGWLSEVNRVFQNYCGEIVTRLTIDELRMVKRAYGGIKLFEPMDAIISAESDESLIVSRFHDAEGGEYYMICSNSVDRVSDAEITFRSDVKVEQCEYGNVFVPVTIHTDPIGAADGESASRLHVPLAPGQLRIYRVTRG